MKKCLLINLLLLSFSFVWSQCPTVVVTPTVSNLSCLGGFNSYTASCYGSSLTIGWYGPGGIPLSSIESGSGPVSSCFTPGNPGIYSIKVKGTNTCVTTKTIQVTASIGVPIFSLLASSYTACSGSSISVQAINVTTSPLLNMSVGYYLGVNTPSSTSSFGNSSIFYTPSGSFYYGVIDQSNSCVSYYNIKVSSSTVIPLPINVVASSSTICNGSSITFTASGANSYIWSNSSISPTMNVFPTSNTVISLQSIDVNSCVVTTTIGVQVNALCATVWPGDSNSDGIVDAQDILELGLNYNTSGPARTFTSNIYAPNDSPVWTGTVSTGKNKAHADCNGDGIVSFGDTLAVYNNFLQTHLLRQAINSMSAQINIVSDQANAFSNTWNTAGIFLGDTSNPIANIYGASFEIDFDTSLIAANDIYISYLNSFINFSITNITFNKEIYNNKRIYGATVRTDGNNVNGNGRIATLYFKPKSNVPNNSVLNLSILNSLQINKDANISALSNGSVAITILNDVGVNKNSLLKNTRFIYPNPASGHVIVNAPNQKNLKIKLIDISGKIINEYKISGNTKIDLQNIQNGIYLVQLVDENQSYCQKLVIYH